ncbi:MAG: TorD/DmsD family molecular chaperone [Casimicrobium sp.]
MSDSSNVAFRPYVAAEDHARANLYALIARLFAAPPDTALIKAIASSPPLATDDDGAALPQAWSKLISASSVIDEDAARDEYEALFGGVGKALVNLHGSHHLAGFMMEKPLSDVRDALKTLGIARLETQTVVEDHISALCETMRLLIVGSGDAASQQKQGSTLAPQSVQTQREFFEAHIAPWVEKMCVEIAKQTLANYYAVVGQLTSAFIQVEREGFSI